MATQENSKTKILVKVHEPLIAIMQYKIDAACLKRDAFLDKALRVEVEFLRKEIATPNSDKAKNYIAAHLSDLKLKPLNLLLSTETVDLINEVCKEKNVPRDAFINRFVLFLIMSDRVLFTIFEELVAWQFGYDYDIQEAMTDFEEVFITESGRHINWGWGESSGRANLYNFENNPTLLFNRSSVLDTIEDSIGNPFTRLRMVTNSLSFFDLYVEKKKPELRPTAEIYLYPFKKNALQRLPSEYDFLKADNALGFNTFMTDEQIAEQEAKDATLSEEVSKKSNHDKLLAAMLKEKQLRTEKTKQSLVEKAKSAGETK